MMQWKRWTALLMLMWAVGLSAQEVTIKDEETNRPLALVTITSQSPKAHAVTDAHGHADVSAFDGSQKIEIRLLGFRIEIMSFEELEQADFQVTMQPSSITLNQFVVVANRHEQETKEVPSKISTISPKQVALQNPQTAADLLGTSGEVYIQKSQQGGGSPMIRGFSTNRILLTVDGVRMNTAIFRSGNVQNVINLDPFATESVEVLFGPGSNIYGSDAIGGVMSFTTLTPTFSSSDQPIVSGNALARYASANSERTGHFDVNIGWKKWALVSSASFSDFDDLRMGKHGPDDYLKPYYVQRADSVDLVYTNEDPLIQTPSGYEQINLMQKIRFKPSESWDFTYAFHYSTTSEYGRYDRHNRLRNGLPRYAEWNYGPQEWMMNQLTITHEPMRGVYDDLVVRLAQQHFEESRIDRGLNAPIRSIRAEEVDAYSVNADFMKQIATRHKLYYGIEGVFNGVASTGKDENVLTGEVVPGPSRYPQSEWYSYAAYVNHQFKVHEDVVIQTGLRYNQFALDARFDTTFYPFPFTEARIQDGALTGSVGAVYMPGETWTMSVNASTGFRAPNVDDVGKVFDSEPGAVVVPNPDLSSEYAYNVDFGIAKVFKDYLKVDVSAYYTVLENAMVRRDYQLNGADSIVYDGELSQVQAIQNASGASVYGVQAGFEAKLPYGFGLSARSNYQVGEEELADGKSSPLRHAAPWFSVAHLTYTLDKLKLDFYGIYNEQVNYEDLPMEERDKTEIYALNAEGKPYVPEWYTLNFKAMYQVNPYIGLSAGVENITDQRYRPFSSGMAGAGRNFILSARVMF